MKGIHVLNKEIMDKDDCSENHEQWHFLRNSETDDNGWKYAISFFSDFTKNQKQFHSVRRRTWVKKVVKFVDE